MLKEETRRGLNKRTLPAKGGSFVNTRDERWVGLGLLTNPILAQRRGSVNRENEAQPAQPAGKPYWRNEDDEP